MDRTERVGHYEQKEFYIIIERVGHYGQKELRIRLYEQKELGFRDRNNWALHTERVWYHNIKSCRHYGQKQLGIDRKMLVLGA